MPLPIYFDFKNPDYSKVFQYRFDKLKKIRANPEILPALKLYYSNNIAQFIIDWGMTFDPRNIERGLPAAVPFLLFPRQEEWVNWFIQNWMDREPGITLKNRDQGLSWLTVATASSICLFKKNVVAGFGSRKEEYVDKIGDPKSLFDKARSFISLLPKEFRGSWDRAKHAPHMRIIFPDTGSIITGEAGDNIGRGNRTSFYFVDESAFLERPQLVDASLSATTNCRQDISTPNGQANPFAEKWRQGKIRQFAFQWRDDPRKDDSWYEKQVRTLDPVTVAQEIDGDFNASVEGVLIPAQWVNAAIDAHKKLGIQPTGAKFGALDIADEGKDLNAFSMRHGVVLQYIESWSGKGSDIYESVEKSFDICDELKLESFFYDADGLGAGAKGDSRKINEKRKENRKSQIKAEAYRGSGGVDDPDGQMVKERTNQDFFANLKAQAWWSLRIRFQNTFRAITKGMEYNKDEIISIDGSIKELSKLMTELSQVTYTKNGTGKILVDKNPEGTKSPNLADSCVMCYWGKGKSKAWGDNFI
jgi:phage terminase large subunit